MSPVDAGVQWIEADPVDQLGRTLDVPDREVAPLPSLERADVGKAAERARRFPGQARQALVDGHAEQRGSHIHRQQQRCKR